MDKHSESKHTVVGRPSSDLVESLVMLNRKSVWQETGVACIQDKKHCERVVEALNLQHAKTVVTPAVRQSESVDGENIRECSWESVRAPDTQSEKASMHDVLDADRTSLYSSALARPNNWRWTGRTYSTLREYAPSPCRAQESMTGRDSSVW